MRNNVTFISAIDTDSGKSIVTGLIGKYLKNKNIKVITQKLAQTGCVGISEDIQTHRKIMNSPINTEDKKGITCPYVFPFPASPHLAAKLVNQEIDINKISDATKYLADKYESVILEGVGGLQVPITEDFTVLDYLEEKKYPTILVTSAKLGSINHTILSLEAAFHRQVPIVGIVYNHYPQSPTEISGDSINIFKKYLKKYGFPEVVVEVPIMKNEEFPILNFSKMINF